MKLIYRASLILWIAKTVFSQKFSEDRYPFPPQFKPPSSGVFGSDSSIYLPPESHTSAPYFTLNNGNKLPYQFLPPTATKIPDIYPTPFPMIMSSTMMSHRSEDDEDEEEMHKRRISQLTSNQRIKSNQTVKHNEHIQEKDNTKPMPKMFNNFQNPIDRVDTKFPQAIHTVSQKPPVNQEPTSQRRMIISNEVLNNDHISNQVKRASILGPQLLSSPVIYYSTTEPAIPILRLSNEMDLDGSFSYEALGADQTHYVQHSRMENSGTDKEEQVVEGSYSYVGDNGQTYTVHYVADSNGYRASGDHLPVPPPIPEIIQRAVQYNLAEEAKKPPHLKNWHEEKEHEEIENEKQRFPFPPPRNLFTGRTPEAFSFGLTQTSVLQNNVPAADNSQVPVKTNLDYSYNQSKSKINNGPIAPQITFLASQGAHNPSVPSAQQQISRIFASEKPTLPQLMNYEAGSSESDQENNKALWRWQYGINANAANENQHPSKNSISRSFGEGDDVIINFNNMSPEQYTKLIKNEFMEPNTEISVGQRESHNKESNVESMKYIRQEKNQNDFITSTERNEKTNISSHNQHVSTENIAPYFFSTTINKDTEYNQYLRKNPEAYSNSNTYLPSTSLAPQPQLADNLFESTKIQAQSSYTTTESSNLFIVKNDQNMERNTLNNQKSNTEEIKNDVTVSSSNIIDEVKNIKFTDFIQKDEKSDFKPITYANLDKEISQETTTADPSPENIIKENIFLKNLFKSDNLNRKSEKVEEPQKPTYNNINTISINKAPKFIQYQSKPQNEVKNNVKKPLDISDVLNYMTFKNYFESSKLNSKNKFSNSGKFSQRFERPQVFIPLENDENQEEEQMNQEESQNHLRFYNNQKQHELRGVIKNYKVLQRNNNIKNMGQSRDQFMTDASSRYLKTMQTQNLPPLGRAGPSTKSYLPPTFV